MDFLQSPIRRGGTLSKICRLLLCSLALWTVQQSGHEAAAEPYRGSSIGGSVSILGKSRCPRVCACNGLTVDCSHRGLTQLPRKISADVERLDLQGFGFLGATTPKQQYSVTSLNATLVMRNSSVIATV